jgi:hypothetical protein
LAGKTNRESKVLGILIKNTEGYKEIVDNQMNIKKETSENTALPPTRRQKPTHKSPTAAGMRQC